MSAPINVTRDDLMALLLLWREANECLDQLEDRRRCGSDGYGLEHRLNRKLDSILELLKKED